MTQTTLTQELQNSLVKFTQDLLQDESVTPNCQKSIAIVQRELEQMGFTCHELIFGEGEHTTYNLFACKGIGNPHLCFAGHVDVVPVGDETSWRFTPFSAQIDQGKIYARGAVDMKSAITAFITAIKSYEQEFGVLADQGTISLIISGDEEAEGLYGTQKILSWMQEQNIKPDACLVGEPTSLEMLGDVIKIGRRGSLSGDIIFKGKQGHAAYPERAVNPIPVAMKALSHLVSYSFDEGTPEFQRTNLELVSLLTSSHTYNVIPEKVTAKFNCRFNPTWRGEELIEKVKMLIHEGLSQSTDSPGSLEVDFTFQKFSEAFLTKPSQLTHICSEAIRGRTGATPQQTTGGGTSDARFIQMYMPVVEFGLVGKTMHQVDENVEIADLIHLSLVYKDIIHGFLNITPL